MNTPIIKLLIPILAILVLGSVAVLAGRSDQVTILSVHSKEASAKFQAKLGLPEGQTAGGRYAVVRIDNGAFGDASFALVYVPPQIIVDDDTVVELSASGASVLTRPGSAVVSRVINTRGAFFST
jgi:N-acetylmuramic acid 6-phosphate (MurNAc-6-P) etherase